MTQYKSELSYGAIYQGQGSKFIITFILFFTIMGQIGLLLLITPFNWIVQLIYVPIFIFLGLLISLFIYGKTKPKDPKYFLILDTREEKLEIYYIAPSSRDVYATSFELSEVWLTFIKRNNKINPQDLIIIFNHNDEIISIYISGLKVQHNKDQLSFKDKVINLQEHNVFSDEIKEFVNSDKIKLFQNLDRIYHFDGDRIFKFEKGQFSNYIDLLNKYLSERSFLTRFKLIGTEFYNQIKSESNATELDILPRSEKIDTNDLGIKYSNLN